MPGKGFLVPLAMVPRRHPTRHHSHHDLFRAALRNWQDSRDRVARLGRAMSPNMADRTNIMRTIGERPAREDEYVVTVPPIGSVADAVASLAKHNIGAVAVTDYMGHAVGILSERDIIKAIAASGPDVLEWTVEDLMTKSIVSCSPSDGLFAAITRMLHHGFRHLLIIDDGALRGVVTIRDLLSALVKKERTERQLLVEMVDTIHHEAQKMKASIRPDDAPPHDVVILGN
jgi:CBS domain-containing protein